MKENYIVPSLTRIGHVHLKVSNLERSLAFYRDLLGFEITTTYGNEAVFLSAGGYHHHIALNTWHSKSQPPPSRQTPGLFHTAIVYPERKDLAIILKRLMDNNYPLTGASNHGVSEAIYLNDPDENGVELYWDRPQSEWPTNSDGSLNMYTRSLNVENLLDEIDSMDPQ